MSSHVRQESCPTTKKRGYTTQRWLDESPREEPWSGVAGLRDASDTTVEPEYATSKGKAQEEIELLLNGRDGISPSLLIRNCAD